MQTSQTNGCNVVKKTTTDLKIHVGLIIIQIGPGVDRAIYMGHYGYHSAHILSIIFVSPFALTKILHTNGN